MPDLIYTQDSFDGGMDLLTPDVKLQSNQYRLAFNVRARNGYLEPIKSPVDITTGLGAFIKIQGLYAFGNILVCFRDGLAYYRNLTSATWFQIPDIQMDPNVDRLWVQAVPQSTLNYQRLNVGATPSAGTSLNNTTVTGSPVCLLVQDGINQPWLIFPDGTSRVTLNYTEWNAATNREYVPIGRQMAYFNGILFIVAADGKSIYRSVTGRPLDFVVAVNNAADKVANAVATSFAIDSNEIMLITDLNADSLLVVTAYTAYAVTLNYERLIYNEPTFNQQKIFTAGVSNQFSYADVLGDFAFIDKEGLKSFNAVLQLRNEGNNSVFSQSVAALFKNIVQTNPCVGSFDNYTFFSVKTVYSVSGILVFDNLAKKFVALDTITPTAIIQFATTYTSSNQQFFAATSTKIYELYPRTGTGFAAGVLFTRAFDSRNTDYGPTPKITEIKTCSCRLLFNSTTTAGIVNFNQLVDEKFDRLDIQKTLAALTNSGVNYPVGAPVIATVVNATNNITFKPEGLRGQKISYAFLWTGGNNLRQVQATMDCNVSPSSIQQESRV